MGKIEWWLLKYSDEFKKIENAEKNNHLFKLDDGSIINLPPLCEKNENQYFLDLYNALNELSILHRYETHFKGQMTEFKKLQSSKVGINKWLLQNEKLGTEKFVCFLIDYLDYDEADKVEHLKIFVHSLTEIDIYVDIADFRNTVDFLENFNKLYWTEEQIA